MAVRPFISYAREDQEFANKLYEDLRALGAEPWLDRHELLGGQDWRETIRNAVGECSHFIALLSSASVSKRGFVQKELRQAIDILEEFPPGEIFLIPVRLEEAEPKHEALQKLHWVDLFPSYEVGLGRLARSLGLEGGTTPTAPRLFGPGGALKTGHKRRFIRGPIRWTVGAGVAILAALIFILNGVGGFSIQRWTDEENCNPGENWVGMRPNTTERIFAVAADEAKNAVFYGEMRWAPVVNQVKQTTVGVVEVEVDGQTHQIYGWNSPRTATHNFEVPLGDLLAGTSGQFKIRWKWRDGTSGVCVAKSEVRL